MRRTMTIAVLVAASAAVSAGPVGARIEPSGFPTILEAPPAPFSKSPRPNGETPRKQRSYYAEIANVSEAEAVKRLAQQEASRPAFERLLRTLRAREKGNFTDARMIHTPDWAYVFYFKRDPRRTLAKYSKFARFKAARARHSTAELDAIARPWVARFTAERLLTGFGTDATVGEVGMDMVVSETEYRAIAARHRWGAMPAAVKLHFAADATGPAVARDAAAMVRIFPHNDRALGITNQALLGGRIVLRDGCFYVTGRGQADRLAYFAREVALGVDAQGYLALRSRGADPRQLGRIGEEFNWGGPIGVSESLPMVAELRARCGTAPLEHVGVPESSASFRSSRP